jgi:hypothetical protein
VITGLDDVYTDLSSCYTDTDGTAVATTRCRDPVVGKAYVDAKLANFSVLYEHDFNRSRRVARFRQYRRQQRAQATLMRTLIGDLKIEDVVFVIGDGYKGMGGFGHATVPIIKTIKYLARHAPVLVTPEWGSTKYSLCCGYETVHPTRDISVCTRQAGEPVRLSCASLLQRTPAPPPVPSAASKPMELDEEPPVAPASAAPAAAASSSSAALTCACRRPYRRDECAGEKLCAYLIMMERWVANPGTAEKRQGTDMEAFSTHTDGAGGGPKKARSSKKKTKAKAPPKKKKKPSVKKRKRATSSDSVNAADDDDSDYTPAAKGARGKKSAKRGRRK